MENLLNGTGLRLTKGREEILKVLTDSVFPLSADEIIHLVDKSIISGSSVYRILNELEHAGILLKTIRQNGISYYEFSTYHKHFILCSECGKVLPIDHRPISPFEESISKLTGFKITGHVIELKGVCPECQKLNI